MIDMRKSKTKKNKGLKLLPEHTLENCLCGAKKHNPKKLKEWRKRYDRMIGNVTKNINKYSLNKKIEKEYRVSATDKVGGEYKDRHNEW